jgi:hypothetical protein
MDQLVGNNRNDPVPGDVRPPLMPPTAVYDDRATVT